MEKRPFRPWAIWRRIYYGVGFFATWGLLAVLIYFVGYYQPPTCFDGKQNSQETGTDCGGECVRICAPDTIVPQVVWAKSFEITPGQYNATAYIENKNQIAATPELQYTFQLLNQGIVVAERSGVTVLPPNSAYPVFEGRIFTADNQPVTETRLLLEPADMWLPASIGRDQFRSLDISLSRADSRPRLDVKIENTALSAADNIEVVATIFNDLGEAVTASQTFVENIAGRSSQDIVFTWPNPIAKTVRSCVIPTDVALAIDLSGSMNNDGGDPPEPVTSALFAASQFANSLQPKDQVSVVTFATRSSVETQLTNVHGAVANAILGFSIAPAEERGFTNTVDALLAAEAELLSERHNDDARRVIVILTDGLPTAANNNVIVEETVETAKMLHTTGFEVYSIGLGKEVDAQFIKDIASDSSNAFFAPTGADLQSIYAEITSSLCESGPTKIDVIAKTKTNFAPLR